MTLITALLANYVFGCVVCTLIDDAFFGGEQSLLKWVRSAPWFVPAWFLVPSLWPLVVYITWRRWPASDGSKQ